MISEFQAGDSSHDLLRKILNALLTGGGSTVTLTASDIEIGAVEIKNGTDDTRLTVFSLANSNPIAARLVDGNGDPVSVGGGTQYAEDTVATSGEQIMMAGVVRRDARSSLVDADGDRTELQVNADGDLRVDGSAVIQPIVGDVDVLTVPAPLSTAGGGTEATALRVTIATDSTGLISVDDNGGSLTVDTPQLPAALVGARLDTNIGAWLGSTTPTVGQKTMADSIPVTLASNQSNVAIDIAAISYLGTFSTRDIDALADNGVAFIDGTSRVHPAGFLFDEVAGTALSENDIAAARIDSKRAQVFVIEDETTRGRRATVTAGNAVKVDGSAVTQPVSVAATLNVNVKPATSGGFTTFHLVSAATTNATVVKASAGQLFGWYIYNSNAAARKVAFHNSSSSPTAGASVFFSIVIPASSGANVFTETGIAFSSGIGITTVTGLADSDATAVAANDLVINLFYA